MDGVNSHFCKSAVRVIQSLNSSFVPDTCFRSVSRVREPRVDDVSRPPNNHRFDSTALDPGFVSSFISIVSGTEFKARLAKTALEMAPD